MIYFIRYVVPPAKGIAKVVWLVIVFIFIVLAAFISTVASMFGDLGSSNSRERY